MQTYFTCMHVVRVRADTGCVVSKGDTCVHTVACAFTAGNRVVPCSEWGAHGHAGVGIQANVTGF